MLYRPTPEQIAASHALGEAVMRFFLSLREQPPIGERPPASPQPASGREAEPAQRLLVSIREAAALLSISDRMLWTLTAPRGPITSIRLGRSVRYSVGHLREWVRHAATRGTEP